MVLEFLGLPDSRELHESRLEQAIIDNLQNFLLELGKGFSAVMAWKYGLRTARSGCRKKTSGLLFETTPENVLMHLKNIYAEQELAEPATANEFLVVQT